MPSAKKGASTKVSRATANPSATKAASESQPANDAQSFESELESLEQLVEHLEHGDIPLAEAVAAYERGLQHAKACEDLLTAAHKRLDELANSDDQSTNEGLD